MGHWPAPARPQKFIDPIYGQAHPVFSKLRRPRTTANTQIVIDGANRPDY
jgi:hypothetical protein